MPTTKYWTGTQWIPIPGPPAGQVWTQQIGDGVNSVFSVWHGLGSRNVIVAVYRNSAPYDEVECDVERTDPNTVTLRTLPYVPTASEFIVAVASGGAQATLNITMDGWHQVGAAGEPGFLNGWVNTGGNYESLRFRKYPDGRVRIQGVVKSGAVGSVVFTLPAGYRPLGQTWFEVISYNGSATIMGALAVTTGGDVIASAPSNPIEVHTNVEFDTESVNQVASIDAQPMDSWHIVGNAGEPTFNGGYGNLVGSNVAFRKTPDGRVKLKGTITTPGSVSGNSVIFTLPAGYRPTIDSPRFGCLTNGGMAYVQIGTDGTVMWSNVAGFVTSATYLALDAVEFDTVSVNAYSTGSFPYLPVTMDNWHVVGAAGEPPFQNSWINYGAPYAALGFRKFPDGKVKLRGLVKSGTINQPIFVLPAGCRPPGQQIFSINASNGSTIQAISLEITADGTVYAGAFGNSWQSIGGVEFDAEDVRQVASSAAQPLDSWHLVGGAGEPAFENSWTNSGGSNAPCGFRKYPDGRVRLHGAVKGGAAQATIFTLPGGYRPPTSLLMSVPVNNGNATGFAFISASTGAVWVNINLGAVGTSSYLDGIEFDTESQSTYASAFVQINAPPKVTSLPVAPVDGQECYFVADAAAGVLWHLRYNAGSASAYKWEWVGGGMLRQEGVGGRDWNAGKETTASTTYVALATVGPSVVVPLAGDYEVEASAVCANVGVGNLTGFLISATGDAALTWGLGDGISIAAGATYGDLIRARRTRTGLAAGTTIQLLYATSNAANVSQFYNRSMWVRPVRVG